MAAMATAARVQVAKSVAVMRDYRMTGAKDREWIVKEKAGEGCNARAGLVSTGRNATGRGERDPMHQPLQPAPVTVRRFSPGVNSLRAVPRGGTKGNAPVVETEAFQELVRRSVPTRKAMWLHHLKARMIPAPPGNGNHIIDTLLPAPQRPPCGRKAACFGLGKNQHGRGNPRSHHDTNPVERPGERGKPIRDNKYGMLAIRVREQRRKARRLPSLPVSEKVAEFILWRNETHNGRPE